MVENTQILKIVEITAKIMALEKGRMIEGSGTYRFTEYDKNPMHTGIIIVSIANVAY